MAVKSIVDIDLNDSKFRAFKSTYDQYSKLLQQSPKHWAQVFMQISKSKKTFDGMVHDAIAVTAQAKLQEAAQKRADALSRTTSERWRDMAKSTRDVASNLKSATGQLVRWASLTTVFSGLLGAGGLFGIDRLAHGVAAGRRQTTGIGTTYGEKKSFDTNYGRLIDSDSFLANVNDVLHDVTKRHALFGAGLNDQQVAGKNTAQVGELLIPLIKRLADRTPDAQLEQALARIPGLVSLQEFQRLKATSPKELAQIQRQYGQDVSSFGLAGSTQKAWQDFAVQVGRAGEKIENVFVKGLEPLTPALTKLSDSFAETVKTFLNNKNLEKWITGFGTAIENVAKYMGTDKFQEDIRNFVDAIGKIAEKTVAVARWIAPVAQGTGRVAGALFGGERPVSGDPNYTYRGGPAHNPGNLRPPGQSTGWQAFATDEDGIRAMARQLKLYQDRDKLNTIQSIVSKYAPSSENDVAAYVGDVTRRTGFGPNQKLDLSNPEVMSRLISAMTKHENSRNNFNPSAVRVMIENNTGGNTIVTTNQVAR